MSRSERAFSSSSSSSFVDFLTGWRIAFPFSPPSFASEKREALFPSFSCRRNKDISKEQQQRLLHPSCTRKATKQKAPFSSVRKFFSGLTVSVFLLLTKPQPPPPGLEKASAAAESLVRNSWASGTPAIFPGSLFPLFSPLQQQLRRRRLPPCYIHLCQRRKVERELPVRFCSGKS